MRFLGFWFLGWGFRVYKVWGLRVSKSIIMVECGVPALRRI